MNQSKRSKEMKDFVVQYFIRVCKNHKIYNTFRSSFNKVKRNRSGNPFGDFKNIYDFKDRLEQFTNKEYEHHRRTNDKYEKVTMMINHMMHFFLEKGGVDPRRLGMIGQEIFDLACYGIYGDEFLNDMELMQEKQPPKPQNDIEAYLMQLYMRMLEEGKIMMTWDEFKQKHMPQIFKAFKELPLRVNEGNSNNFYDVNEYDSFDNDLF